MTSSCVDCWLSVDLSQTRIYSRCLWAPVSRGAVYRLTFPGRIAITDEYRIDSQDPPLHCTVLYRVSRDRSRSGSSMGNTTINTRLDDTSRWGILHDDLIRAELAQFVFSIDKLYFLCCAIFFSVHFVCAKCISCLRLSTVYFMHREKNAPFQMRASRARKILHIYYIYKIL